MPYKVAKQGDGYRLIRKATDGKPAREMSHHPQTKTEATAQLGAIEANSPEKHNMEKRPNKAKFAKMLSMYRAKIKKV